MIQCKKSYDGPGGCQVAFALHKKESYPILKKKSGLHNKEFNNTCELKRMLGAPLHQY